MTDRMIAVPESEFMDLVCALQWYYEQGYQNEMTDIRRKLDSKILRLAKSRLAEIGEDSQSPSVPDGMILISLDLVKFLNGEQDLDGVWMGERHPEKRGLFWWREYLPAAPKPNEGEV